MFTKRNIINICSKLVQWVPIAVYACFNIDTLYSTPDRGITVSAIVLLGAVLMYFKDSFRDWLAHPSTFKYIVIVWVISLVFVVLGNQLFEITSVLLASFLASIPLEVWYKHIDKEALDNDVTKKLKELLVKDEK